MTGRQADSVTGELNQGSFNFSGNENEKKVIVSVGLCAVTSEWIVLLTFNWPSVHDHNCVLKNNITTSKTDSSYV